MAKSINKFKIGDRVREKNNLAIPLEIVSIHREEAAKIWKYKVVTSQGYRWISQDMLLSCPQ